MPSSKLRRSPARTLSAIGFRCWSLNLISLISNLSEISNAPDCHGRAPEQQEQQTNIAVHREKRSIEPAEVVGLDKRVFVTEEQANCDDAGPCGPRKSEACGKPREQRNDQDMHNACDPERSGDAETLRNRVETRAAVELHVLAGVQHVEATDPECHSGAENQHSRVEAAGDRDPRRCRRNAQARTKDEMRPRRETFGVRVEK